MPNILDFALKNRFLILLAFVLVTGLGLRAMFKTPVDAFPAFSRADCVCAFRTVLLPR